MVGETFALTLDRVREGRDPRHTLRGHLGHGRGSHARHLVRPAGAPTSS